MQITPRSIQVSVVKDISAHVPDYKNKQNYNDCYKNAETLYEKTYQHLHIVLGTIGQCK